MRLKSADAVADHTATVDHTGPVELREKAECTTQRLLSARSHVSVLLHFQIVYIHKVRDTFLVG